MPNIMPVCRTVSCLAGILANNDVVMVGIELLSAGELNPPRRILGAAVHQIGGIGSKVLGSWIDTVVILK